MAKKTKSTKKRKAGGKSTGKKVKKVKTQSKKKATKKASTHKKVKVSRSVKVTVVPTGEEKQIKEQSQQVQQQQVQKEQKGQSQEVKTYYSKEEIEHFKQILLKKREEILEVLESHRQSLIESATQNDKPVGTPYSIHMEYGTETEEREKTMFFIAREEKMLNYIDAALMRIERGNYGICISCGKLIDKRRLEAVPHTQLCIECKLAQKKRF